MTKQKCSHKCLHFKDIHWISWITSHKEEIKEPKFVEPTHNCYYTIKTIRVDVVMIHHFYWNQRPKLPVGLNQHGTNRFPRL